MSEAPKSRFELVVELVKAMAWPTLATVLLFTFWTPLRETAKQIPGLVGRSDTVTIAGLSLKVSRGLRQKASPAIKKVLSELSREDIERILSMSSGSWWDVGSESFARSENSELLRLRLLEEVPASELQTRNSQEGRHFGFAVRPTELGKSTQSFLRSVVAEFVQGLELSGAE